MPIEGGPCGLRVRFLPGGRDRGGACHRQASGADGVAVRIVDLQRQRHAGTDVHRFHIRFVELDPHVVSPIDGALIVLRRRGAPALAVCEHIRREVLQWTTGRISCLRVEPSGVRWIEDAGRAMHPSFLEASIL